MGEKVHNEHNRFNNVVSERVTGVTLMMDQRHGVELRIA